VNASEVENGLQADVAIQVAVQVNERQSWIDHKAPE
jgi:hypothetical protein